ncbi:MAG: envelope stress response membrane protein PspC [Gammaproteobacteria bacterium]|nr:envelope stress response membrane protein PspC [Gammaproteobacteria bacterium]
MSHDESLRRRRFYRDSDRAFIAGVCAGLADYFGFNLKVTRVLAVFALFMAMPAALIAYFGTVLLVPSRSENKQHREYDPAFRQALRSDPVQTLGDVRRRYQGLDSRLARLERYVTSSRFNLDQEFKQL